MLPKFIVYSLSFIVLIFSVAFPVSAQTLTPLPPTVSPTSPLYTDLLVNNLFHSFSCLAIGQSVIGQPCLTYQVTKNAQGMIQGVPMLSSVNLSGGTLGATTSLIGALYENPPVRTIDYLASVGHGLGIVKTANAQVVGSGAAVLNPILALWQTSRNISYVIMIIIFLVIGLMVMFRNKINPQTVITAQAALPGLVIGLIMITFSFFFAGLISDMAFVGTNVVGYYFAAAQGPTALADPERINLADNMSKKNIMSIFSTFAGEVISSDQIHQAVNTFIGNLTPSIASWVRIASGVIAYQVGAQFGGALGGAITPAVCAATGIGVLIAPMCGAIGQLGGQAIVGGTTGAIAAADPGWTFSGVLYLLTIVIIIYTLFRLVLRLINAYLAIIFLTISAPFQFLAAALPGRQGLATQWIRNILSNVLAFPAVLAVLYFAAFLIGQSFGPLKVTSYLNPKPDNAFVSTVHAADPPQSKIVGTSVFPLFGGMDISFLAAIAAFGALLVTPAIPDIIARSIGTLSQTGQLLGQEISSGISGGQRYGNRFGTAPGQAGQSLSAFGQQVAPKYSTVMKDGLPVTIKEQGLLGRLKGKGPEEVIKPP